MSAAKEPSLSGRTVSTVIFLTIPRGSSTLISKSSGYPALDEAALSVAATMQFTPAYNRDEPVSVWVEIPIVFTIADLSPISVPSPSNGPRFFAVLEARIDTRYSS